MTPIFITGIGTGVGKTIASIIVANALGADYWKPIQAGFEDGTDSQLVREFLHEQGTVHPESYRLARPASPHIAARSEGIVIDLEKIAGDCNQLACTNVLVIEGAGGVLVPLNEQSLSIDLIEKLQAKVIIVSRNYLGSINHSLLTAAVCRQRGLDVLGWIFNDDFMHYEDEVAAWSGYQVIGKIPALISISKESLDQQSTAIQYQLKNLIDNGKHE